MTEKPEDSQGGVTGGLQTQTPAEAGAGTAGPVRGATTETEGHPLLTAAERFSRKQLIRVKW